MLSKRLTLAIVLGLTLAGALTACTKGESAAKHEAVIRVDYLETTFNFTMNENADCGTLDDGLPYVEAKWLQAPSFEEEPPFFIQGRGGWTGNTYEDPHTWIFGVYATGNRTQELGFAIYGEELPGFDADNVFRWSGVTPLGQEMTVEVICP
ncbi:MAG: hypothetical protein AAGH76_09595 [Pseudomonadota bacterium]